LLEGNTFKQQEFEHIGPLFLTLTKHDFLFIQQQKSLQINTLNWQISFKKVLFWGNKYLQMTGSYFCVL